MSWTITPQLRLDPEAAFYIDRVEAADGQSLEPAVIAALDTFVRGCKADGIWTAIKACCILAGARTLNGALVPLVGTAPTSFNFVSGDYNRKTGLVGNGSTKYIRANINSNALPQNSIHCLTRITTVATIKGQILAASNPSGQAVEYGLLENSSNGFIRANNSGNAGSQFSSVGSYGLSRALSSSYNEMRAGIVSSVNIASNTPLNRQFDLYANGLQVAIYSDPRLAFYSIGESLDLALLDARVTTLITAFSAAIA